MKKRMEQDATNSTISALEVQLQQLIKAFTDYSNVAAKQMHNSGHKGFVEVCTKLDSIYNIILRRGQESADVQYFMSIGIEPRVRNIQVPPTAIDAG